VALSFTLKSYFKAKTKFWKNLKYISPCKNIIFKKKSSKKETKILEDIITL